MKIEVFASADEVASAAAGFIAARAREAVAQRGLFTFAVSGGNTPWQMLRALAREDVPWEQVHLFQVDERVAPAGHPDRNFTHVQESLLARVPLDSRAHPMPVELPALEAAAAAYATTLNRIAGSPAILDLIHLGLGGDGHTASLVPGDAVLEVTDRDVALSGPYQGTRRMTLTFPMLNRARQILWVVTGAEKAEMLRRLESGDISIPAGRVEAKRAIVFADAKRWPQLRPS